MNSVKNPNLVPSVSFPKNSLHNFFSQCNGGTGAGILLRILGKFRVHTTLVLKVRWPPRTAHYLHRIRDKLCSLSKSNGSVIHMLHRAKGSDETISLLIFFFPKFASIRINITPTHTGNTNKSISVHVLFMLLYK